MRVAIAGLPGSGKSTAAKRSAEALGVRMVSAGGLFRDLAEEKQLTLAQFSQQAERDPAIDRELDQRMAKEARKGDLVMEGRLTGWVCREFRIPAFKVFLAAPEQVRAQRIAQREGLALERALADNRARERSEHTRYLRYYGADMQDRKLYDLWLETEAMPPDEVARRIVEGAKAHAPA